MTVKDFQSHFELFGQNKRGLFLLISTKSHNTNFELCQSFVFRRKNVLSVECVVDNTEHFICLYLAVCAIVANFHAI